MICGEGVWVLETVSSSFSLSLPLTLAWPDSQLSIQKMTALQPLEQQAASVLLSVVVRHAVTLYLAAAMR
jgi:hypothetical protein